jgi:hypothetical protein
MKQRIEITLAILHQKAGIANARSPDRNWRSGEQKNSSEKINLHKILDTAGQALFIGELFGLSA